MSDPAASTGVIDALLALGPGGLVAVLAIAWGTQQRKDAVEARAARDKMADDRVADVTKLTEAMALGREQGQRVERALEQSGTHRIIP